MHVHSVERISCNEYCHNGVETALDDAAYASRRTPGSSIIHVVKAPERVERVHPVTVRRVYMPLAYTERYRDHRNRSFDRGAGRRVEGGTNDLVEFVLVEDYNDYNDNNDNNTHISIPP